MGEWALQKNIYQRKISIGRHKWGGTDLKMKEVKLGLIHTMTRANRINPPSLEEGRGWWGIKLRQALQ